MTDGRRTGVWFALVALVAVYAVGFGVLAARSYPAHESGAYDLGNNTQALWNAAHGRGLSLTLTYDFGPTRWSMHAEPVLFLLAPVFRWVTDDPRFLLWLQAAVIALGGFPLYGLSRRRLHSDWAALGVVLVYFMLPALESVTLFDFHAVGLAPTLLLAGWYWLDRALAAAGDPRGIWPGRASLTSNPSPLLPLRPVLGERQSRTLLAGGGWGGEGTPRLQPPLDTQEGREQGRVATYGVLAALFFLLALATKEDIALHVVLIGVYLIATRGHWRPGLALAVIGLAWFYLAAEVIIPSSRPDGSQSAYLGYFAGLGRTPLEILLSPLRAPAKVLALLTAPDTWHGLGMLTIPVAGLSLAGWPFLLMAAPSLAIALLSSNPLMHRLETYHYAAPALPFVILAAAEGVGRTSGWLAKLPVTDGAGRQSDAQTVSPWARSFRSVRYGQALGAVMATLLMASLVYHDLRGYSPLARSFRWPQVTAHERLGDALMAQLPADSPVIAQAELVPQLARRPWIRIWQGPFDPTAEYVILDVTHPAFVNRSGAQQSLLSDMAQDSTVGLAAAQDGYLLLRRGAPRLPTPPEFFSFVYADPPPEARAVQASFGDVLQLTAFEATPPYGDREGDPLLTLYWRVARPPVEDYLICILLLDETGRPVGATLNQQPLTVWWPTSRWEVGHTVRVLANTFPWWTGDRQQFGYGVAVVRGTDPWERAARLPVTRADDGPAALDDGTLLPLVRFQRLAGIVYAE
jgi:uncharacterized membrane protein